MQDRDSTIDINFDGGDRKIFPPGSTVGPQCGRLEVSSEQGFLPPLHI